MGLNCGIAFKVHSLREAKFQPAHIIWKVILRLADNIDIEV
jgi:hypothetical protein